jgi:hypothetical protein
MRGGNREGGRANSQHSADVVKSEKRPQAVHFPSHSIHARGFPAHGLPVIFLAKAKAA